MKKMILIGLVTSITLAGLILTGCGQKEKEVPPITEPPGETPSLSKEFQLFSSKVTSEHCRTAIALTFNTSETVDLFLIGPDGKEIDSTLARSDRTSAILFLGEWGENPEPGQYQLKVTDHQTGETLLSKIFNFEGENFRIVAISATWKETPWVEGYYLDLGKLTIENLGDLPGHLIEGEIRIGERVYPCHILGGGSIMPYEERDNVYFTSSAKCFSKNEAFEIKLMDSTGEVYCRYSSLTVPGM